MKYWVATLIAIGIFVFIYLLAVIAEELSEKSKSKRYKIILKKFSNFIFDYFNPVF